MITLIVLMLLGIAGVFFFPLLIFYFVFVLTFKILFGVAWIFFSLGRVAIVGTILLLLLCLKLIAFLPLWLLIGLGLWIIGMLTGRQHYDHADVYPQRPYRNDVHDSIRDTLRRMESRIHGLEAKLARKGYWE